MPPSDTGIGSVGDGVGFDDGLGVGLLEGALEGCFVGFDDGLGVGFGCPE